LTANLDDERRGQRTKHKCKINWICILNTHAESFNHDRFNCGGDPEVGHVIKIIPIKCIFHVKRLSWRNNLNARTGLYGIACKQTGTAPSAATHMTAVQKLSHGGIFLRKGGMGWVWTFPRGQEFSPSALTLPLWALCNNKNKITFPVRLIK